MKCVEMPLPAAAVALTNGEEADAKAVAASHCRRGGGEKSEPGMALQDYNTHNTAAL